MLPEPVSNQALKIGAIWTVIGITSWAEAASFFAAILSALALGEYMWKKWFRPMLVHLGYLSPKRKLKLVEVDDE